MKTLISQREWYELEMTLARLNVGYKVIFDNHHGEAEMIINIDQVSVMRPETKEGEE